MTDERQEMDRHRYVGGGNLVEVGSVLEKDIERRMGDMLKRRGCLYYKFESPGNPGVPDRIVITPAGRVVFVELKTQVGRLSGLQKYQIDRMREAGAEVRTVKGWEQAKAFVEEVATE